MSKKKKVVRIQSSDSDVGISEYHPSSPPSSYSRSRAYASSSSSSGSSSSSVSEDEEEPSRKPLPSSSRGDRTQFPPSKSDDYWDPRNLPNERGPRRNQHQLKILERACYASAVHDVVGERWDLGKCLLEWEGIRGKREREEEELRRKEEVQAGKQKELDEEEEEERERIEERFSSPSSAEYEDETVKKERKKRKRRNYVTKPLPASSSTQDEPFPSSHFVASMARWPLAPSLLPPPRFTFADELSALLKRVSPSSSSNSTQRPRKRPRNAYGPGGPFFVPGAQPITVEGSSSSSEEDEEEDALDSSDDELLPGDLPIEKQHLLLHLANTVDDVLSDLAGLVPPGLLPPKTWLEQNRRDVETAGKKEKALGWETVVAVVRDSGKVSPRVIEIMKQRLEKIYGASEIPVLTPPTSRLDLFQTFIPPDQRPIFPPGPNNSASASPHPSRGNSPTRSPRSPRRRSESRVSIPVFAEDIIPEEEEEAQFPPLPFPHLAFDQLPPAFSGYEFLHIDTS